MRRVICLLSFILVLSLSQTVQSQEEIPKLDIITFNDGTIMEGRVADVNIGSRFSGELNTRGRHFVKNGNLKICKDEKNKNCSKYPIEDIDNIVISPSPLLLRKINKLQKKHPDYDFDLREYVFKYKVLYSPVKNLPRLCLLEYKGENANFYHFNKTSMNDKFSHGEYFITKPDNNIIEFHFPALNTKKNVDHLNEYFKDCSTFLNESTKKKAYKDKETLFFFKLTDSCNQ